MEIHKLPNKRFYVYILISDIYPHNKGIFYIGKSSKQTKIAHFRPRHHIRTAVNGKNKFYVHHTINSIKNKGGKVDYDIVYETDDEQDAYSKEIELIAKYGIKTLCNLTIGGDGVSCTPEIIEKRRQKIIGHKTSEETKDKIRKSLTGKKRPKEVGEKISKSKKKQGCKLSKEHIQKMVNGKKRWKMPDSQRKDISMRRSIPIKIRETGEVFQSASEAGKIFKINPTCISYAVRSNGRCCGHTWERLDNPKTHEFYIKEKDGRSITKHNYKKVECLETGEIFEAVSKAAEYAHVTSSYMSKAINKGYTAGGYHWVRIDSENDRKDK